MFSSIRDHKSIKYSTNESTKIGRFIEKPGFFDENTGAVFRDVPSGMPYCSTKVATLSKNSLSKVLGFQSFNLTIVYHQYVKS